MNRLSLILVLKLIFIVSLSHAKIVNFGPKLTDYIEEHPDKSWLVKFYVPWCHHCKQLEPVFLDVAEYIYHRHDKLIVGRVDCTKYGSVCDKYEVRSYPKIAYLNKNTQVVYNGDRSAKSIIEFAERLEGPDVHLSRNCTELQHLSDSKGLIVVSTLTKESSLFNGFQSFASLHKSRYWFYQLLEADNKCSNYQLSNNGIYIIKRGSHKAIKFDQLNFSTSIDELQKSFIKWINENSYPIFGPIGTANLDVYLSRQKPLVLAILDHYQPAKRFTESSQEFHDSFEYFVKKSEEQYSSFLFGWTSDLDLIRGLILGQIVVPNVIIIHPNYTYHLLIQNQQEAENKMTNTHIPEKLSHHNLKTALSKLDQLSYNGGNSYIHSLMRHIYGQYSVYSNMYAANPLLASILVGLPSIILIFVIYTTCCYDEQSDDDAEYNQLDDGEDDDDDDEDDYMNDEESEENGYEESRQRRAIERQRLFDKAHMKQE